MDLEPVDTDVLQGLADHGKDLQVGGGRIHPHYVEVALVELPVAPFLGVLSPPYLGYVVPLEGEWQLVQVCTHEPGKGNSKVESHGNITVAVVGEAVDLLVGLAAALA